MTTKQKGSIAEMAVAADLVRRGYAVALPVSECSEWDLLFDRSNGKPIERVQVKYCSSDDSGLLLVRTRCHSNVAARRTTKTYSADDVDWIAAYDAKSGTCYYIPTVEVENKEEIRLRLYLPTKGSTSKCRMAENYAKL